MTNNGYATGLTLCVALGGFLMGFDASVISGVVGFIETDFALSKVEVGWAVASLTLTSTAAMLVAGPMAQRFGRLPVLRGAAIVFLVSAIGCAFATSFSVLVVARMLGGFGVGAALIIAPMYIAEIAPAAIRGRLVSFNQLNIVVGISAAFFSNYLLLQMATDNHIAGFELWRWMLGVEAIPAAIYLLLLSRSPESPRWLVAEGRGTEALAVLRRLGDDSAAQSALQSITASLKQEPGSGDLRQLFGAPLRAVLLAALTVSVLQQITGINAVFFYAPVIFEQSGIGTDAAFLQAVLVGLVNLVFTVVAILTIDRFGRRRLLQFGVSGIVVFMAIIGFSFSQASWRIDAAAVADEPRLGVLLEREYESASALRSDLSTAAPDIDADVVVRDAIDINAGLVLFGILGFVACFAFSLGPVMWVLFSELFPNSIRAIAISFVGVVNSAVSFLV